MLKNISNLGKALNKTEQQEINGGVSAGCPGWVYIEAIDTCVFTECYFEDCLDEYGERDPFPHPDCC